MPILPAAFTAASKALTRSSSEALPCAARLLGPEDNAFLPLLALEALAFSFGAETDSRPAATTDGEMAPTNFSNATTRA